MAIPLYVLVGEVHPNGQPQVWNKPQSDASLLFELAALRYDARTSPFTPGATLTGGTSGATATIIDVIPDANDSSVGVLLLKFTAGAFHDNETITDNGGTPGSATANGRLVEDGAQKFVLQLMAPSIMRGVVAGREEFAANAASDVTVDGTANKFIRAAGWDFIPTVGTTITSSGFANGANNGTWVVTSTTSTEIFVQQTSLVDELVPPASATIKRTPTGRCYWDEQFQANYGNASQSSDPQYVVYNPMPNAFADADPPLLATPTVFNGTSGSTHQRRDQDGFGPDTTLMSALDKKHPEGFALLKFSSAGGPPQYHIKDSVVVRVDQSTKQFILDSGSWSATPSVGSVIESKGFSNAGNNSQWTVTATTSSTITVQESGMVTESAGQVVNIFQAAQGQAGAGIGIDRTDPTNIGQWHVGEYNWTQFRAMYDAAKALEKDASKGLNEETYLAGIITMFTEGDVRTTVGGQYLDVRSGVEKWVADVRTDLGAHAKDGDADNIKFLFMLPDPEHQETAAPLAAIGVRQQIQDAVRLGALTNVGAWDADGFEYAYASIGLPAEPANNAFFETRAYLAFGTRMMAGIDALDNPAVYVAGAAAPVILILGQSQIGTFLDPLFALYNDDPELLQVTSHLFKPGAGSLLDPQKLIWNPSTGQMEQYNMGQNSVGVGNFGANNIGPEVTFYQRTKERFESLGIANQNIYVFKGAWASSGLHPGITPAPSGGIWHPDANDIWPTLTSELDRMFDWLRDQGLHPSLELIIWDQGENDAAAGLAIAQQYGTALDEFLTALIARYKTRAIGPDPNVVIGRLHGSTPLGASDGARDAVRAAQDAYAVSRSNVSIADLDALKFKTDPDAAGPQTDVHFTGISVFRHGELWDEAWSTIAGSHQTPTEAAESAAGGEADSGGADAATAGLTVEDGTGLADANSYLSVADADAYHDGYGNPSEWSNATTAEKEEDLRKATRALDALNGGSWLGVRANEGQALDWPRVGAEDPDGFLFSSTALPRQLEHATAIVALLYRQGEDPIADLTEDAPIHRIDQEVVGSVRESITYVGGRSSTKTYRLLERTLADLVEAGGRLFLG